VNTYDQVPYGVRVFPQTHPDRLATSGRLFPLSPQSVTRCRVRELGCATGANLIPMNGEYGGGDLSERQVRTARASIEGLGLRNIRIEEADILDVEATSGVFDDVLCHGVYSWAADDVKAATLRIASLVREIDGMLSKIAQAGLLVG
jgi:hypothetical protein